MFEPHRKALFKLFFSLSLSKASRSQLCRAFPMVWLAISGSKFLIRNWPTVRRDKTVKKQNVSTDMYRRAAYTQKVSIRHFSSSYTSSRPTVAWTWSQKRLSFANDREGAWNQTEFLQKTGHAMPCNVFSTGRSYSGGSQTGIKGPGSSS